ncbi:hypothetical protein SCG7109_AJ_00220 [Chlamydiales bacterium SCGC AG-110-M15]|nr:hypothetical protein SCG7109_AJ_00220 [Chlamydiales bacterium SCGC AG-110-M15]
MSKEKFSKDFCIAWPPEAKEVWKQNNITKIKINIYQTSIDLSFRPLKHDWVTINDSFLNIFYGPLHLPFIEINNSYVQDNTCFPGEVIKLTKSFPERFYIIKFFPIKETYDIPPIAIDGILLSCFGKGIHYEKIFSENASLEEGGISITSPSIENPLSYPLKPNPSVEKLELLSQLIDKTLRLESHVKNRVTLSLDWYQQSIFFSEPRNTFLSQWVAIECLSEHDQKIGPLKEILKKNYPNDPHSENLGKICSLRSDMVHRGIQFPINQYFSDYLSLIYLEILHHIIGIDSQRGVSAYVKQRRKEIKQTFENIKKITEKSLTL